MKEKYTEASIDVIPYEPTDVITTSGGGSMSTGGSNTTSSGWTPVEW